MSKPGKKKDATQREPAPRLGPDEFWRHNPEIVQRFLDVRRDYQDLCVEVEYILRKRLRDRRMEIAAITSRAKTLNSFLEKLQRKNYEDPFTEITDLAGARVVCLYRSDIDQIDEVIRSEFEIVEDSDKISSLAPDQFGYIARHFIVRLGRASSGARYDDLKSLSCEVQVRTVVQDAWAIIQHHMVYKRESQAPAQVQRKLNSLAGLFETADDQFERIREERHSYLAKVKESSERFAGFLENELNLDTFREYLTQTFPNREFEAWDGQGRITLDGLLAGGYKTLRDLDATIKNTAVARKFLVSEMTFLRKAPGGDLPSNVEAALALAITAPDWKELLPFGETIEDIVSEYREEKRERV